MSDDRPITIEEARQLFREAADAAEAKLPMSVAGKLTVHLRDIAETCDFESAVGSMIAGAWHRCARDLISMTSSLPSGGGLMGEVACEVKKSDWFGSGFTSWCGRRFEESRPEDWWTPVCPACKAAKAKSK